MKPVPLLLILWPLTVVADTLDDRLLRESPAELAAAAAVDGDVRRGAILFHQPYMACRKCHAPDDRGRQLGPDLTRWERPISDVDLVTAILKPSASIRKGFESLTVVTGRGETIVGLVVKNGDPVLLRDPSLPGKLYEFPRDDLEAIVPNSKSLMPEGLANQLSSRQQFLDLLRYLMEIRDGGPLRARNLEPAPHLYAAPPLPEYEQHVDHAGMIRDLGPESFERGQAIHNRLCVNCHGTHDRPGSLPTSPRFATGRFKNGSDPYTMYQTLTRGFGLMQPQTWMVPQQKYDVIHYIREAYLKPHNPSQHDRITDEWLSGLPRGDTRGPSPRTFEPWITMDYGRSLINTYEAGNDGSNFAYKGIAVRLDPGPGGVSRGTHWMIFDHDTLRMAAAWSGQGFVDWNGIHFNDKHGVHPRTVGDLHVRNRTGPGWADPDSQSWDDPRLVGRDDRRYGPLPREWGRYRGLYSHGNDAIIAYTIGQTEILESPRLLTTEPRPVFARRMELAPRTQPLTLQVAQLSDDGDLQPAPSALTNENVVLFVTAPAALLHGETAPEPESLMAGFLFDDSKEHTSCKWEQVDGALTLAIPPSDDPLALTVWFASLESAEEAAEVLDAVRSAPAVEDDLHSLSTGGPARWPEVIETPILTGDDAGPFAADVLARPVPNPWLARVRFTGFDFFEDGNTAAICAWDGDVWKVTGLNDPRGRLKWRRIASGLFQPLGLKIVDGRIHVTCRDQIVILHDLNGDGETDFFENFNNDHQVTEHFHEFAMGLQTDEAGNFYYAKSARHAKPALVPHHGTLLRVSPDGSRTDILATGFRAANGVCLTPDGSFIVTDQEGHWIPKNRINWVREGGFYGNMMGYHDVTDTSDDAMEQPLCWITNRFDRSPAELIWIPDGAWGPLGGSLLNVSYGYGKVYVVLHEEVNGQKQGGMCELPLPQFPTGLVRGRFHPTTGDLYTCGMFAWAGNQTQPGGFYRIRATGRPMHLPVGLRATRSGIQLEFTDPLDRDAAEDPDNYSLTVWDLKRSAKYGSDHHNERSWPVDHAALSADGKTVRLIVPDIAPTQGMEIRCFLETANGNEVERRIHNTIHHLGD